MCCFSKEMFLKWDDLIAVGLVYINFDCSVLQSLSSVISCSDHVSNVVINTLRHYSVTHSWLLFSLTAGRSVEITVIMTSHPLLHRARTHIWQPEMLNIWKFNELSTRDWCGNCFLIMFIVFLKHICGIWTNILEFIVQENVDLNNKNDI